MDDTAAFGKIFHVADGQHAGPLELGQDLAHGFLLGLTDEEKLAGLEFFDIERLLDHHGPAAEGLVTYRRLQGVAERVFAQNADDKRRCIIRERAGRPFHKFREIAQKSGFDLVLQRDYFRRPRRLLRDHIRDQRSA